MSNTLDPKAAADIDRNEGKKALIGWLSFAAIVAVVVAGALLFSDDKPVGRSQNSVSATTHTTTK